MSFLLSWRASHHLADEGGEYVIAAMEDMSFLEDSWTVPTEVFTVCVQLNIGEPMSANTNAVWILIYFVGLGYNLQQDG